MADRRRLRASARAPASDVSLVTGPAGGPQAVAPGVFGFEQGQLLAGVRPLAAGEDPHRGWAALEPPGPAQQPGQLGDVRFLDPAGPVRAAVAAADAVRTALAVASAHRVRSPPAASARASRLPGQTNSGSAAVRSASALIAASSGAPVNRLAASSTFGSRSTSPTLQRNTPGRLIAHHTDRSMSSCCSSGWYQVARVCGRPAQGRSAIDLIVCTAMRCSRQVSYRALKFSA